jgi:hypothetical protein
MCSERLSGGLAGPKRCSSHNNISFDPCVALHNGFTSTKHLVTDCLTYYRGLVTATLPGFNLTAADHFGHVRFTWVGTSHTLDVLSSAGAHTRPEVAVLHVFAARVNTLSTRVPRRSDTSATRVHNFLDTHTP